MANLSIIFDVVMCIFWIVTYFLVLIGTIRYRYPLISPISQLFFGTNEIAALLYFAISEQNFNYVDIAYLLWALIEIAIFTAIVRLGFIKKKFILPYLSLILIITVILCIAMIKGYMMFICYFNAFAGVLFWYGFILKKEYPMKVITLAAFASKFLADLVAVPVYLGDGGIIIDLMCLVLPLLDLFFIITFFVRKIKVLRRE